MAYGLDSAGMLRSVAEGTGPSPAATAAFFPNRDGQLTSELLPGAVRVANGIDGAGRTITVKVTNSTATGTGTPTPVAAFDYHYDALGRTTGETDTVGGVTQAFASATPDAAGRLTQVMAGPRLLHYTYDPAGNIQALTVNGLPGSQYQYVAGQPDELAAVTGAAGSAVALGAYDANGNPGSVGDGGSAAALGYDTRGRLQSLAATNDRPGVRLGYDASGRRTVVQVFPAATATQTSYSIGYGYRGGQLARLTVAQDSPQATNTPVPAECNANDAQGCTETFVYRQDGVPLELLYTPAKNNLTQRYWYETDAHGSVVALTNTSGQVVQRYVYGPWGDLIPLLSGPELVPQPLRYRGYVYDRELTGRAEASGWYWLGVRSYDPNIGRFIQPDPSEQEGTRSYVYCGDAPLDCSDPSGLLSLEDVRNGIYQGAQAAAGGYDVLTFGAFSHVAGAFGARVDQQSAAYQIGSLVTGVALTVASLGADPTADAAVAGDAARVGEESLGVGEGALAHPTGAYNPSASGTGVGLGRLADRSINVSERGLNLVKGHLARFAELYGSIPYNDAMIGRLQSALDAGRSIEGADASFYLHEASEATMMRVLEQAGSTFDTAYDVAHSAALAKYDVSPFSVYHPDVIQAFRADFSPAFRRFWGIS